jgi:hypothetical protein
LTIFSRTSDRKTINVASWHSPHSLTWRWILSLRRHQITWPKPFMLRNKLGFGMGFGTLLSFNTYRTNGGVQWQVSAFWCGLDFSQQQPMWFKDMARDSWNEEERLKHENYLLRQEVDAAKHIIARAENPVAGAHLN